MLFRSSAKSQEVGAAMYAAGAEAAGDGGASDADADEDIVEGEVIDEDTK